MFRWDDTIAALASPPGAGLRGIVRVTGPATIDVLRELFTGNPSAETWHSAVGPSRFEGSLFWSECRTPISAALQLWPTTRSYTGQPLAELHLVSSPPLLEAVLSELFRRGARPARPGEFTLRAFLAGKLDLLQAEAVVGVIDAHDHAELKTALEQLAGGISHQLTVLRSDLLNLLADLEAGLDFVDEHLEFVTNDELQARLSAAHQTVQRLCDQATNRSHSGDVPRVVLAGLPNAGKSTLFNSLVGQSWALVSAIPGTTRDYLTARITWSGQTFELIDTAGFDTDAAGIEGAAQDAGQDQWRRADLVVWCSPPDSQDEDASRAAVGLASNVVRLMTKADLLDADAMQASVLAVSAAEGRGLDELRDLIVQSLGVDRSGGRRWLGVTAARCRESLQSAALALGRAKENVRDPGEAFPGLPDELIAVEIREALEHLGAIVGAVYTDDLLDRIFSRFCIGK